MTKRSVSFLLICLVIFSCSHVKQVQQREKLPTAIPTLRIQGDTTAKALKISSLSVDVTVAANIATTTFDITFYNPNDRILEGEFEFPLANGQHVVRYALDIEGKLREGVVVEKAKARAAFENTIRRKIDPGLVEKTKGNNFRTRIYPLPAQGSRHILIAVEQTLEHKEKDLLYLLPLFATEPIGNFSIKTTVVKNTERPAMEESGLSNFRFQKWNNAWVAVYGEKDFIANQTIAFTIPATSTNETMMLAENYNGQTYFYVHSRTKPGYKEKKTPSSIAVFWDISASGEKRNIEKEKQILKAYLSKLGDVKVSLIPFHVFTEGKQDFEIRNGNGDALLDRINGLKYDGGTQFGSIDLTQLDAEEILMFSDGLSTFGKKEITLSAAPVTTISSSAASDFSHLKYLAQQSGGQFIDLNSLETDDAVMMLQNQSLQVVNIEYNAAEIEELAIQTPLILNRGLSFSGKLKVPSASVSVSIGFGKNVTATKTFVITRPDSSEYDQVKRIWATMKISELDLQFEKNKDVITKLGKEFSIVTQNTSLIVLDRVEDYVEHEITPPEELQKEYFALLKEKKQTKKDEKTSAMEEAVTAMNELKEWWNTDYLNKGKQLITNKSTTPVIIANQMGLNYRLLSSDSSITSGTGSYRSNGVSRTLSDSVSARVVYNFNTNGNATVVETGAVPFLSISEQAKAENMDEQENVNKPTASSVELNEWKPDAPYLKELEKAPANKRIATYFQLKKLYAAQPSFFIDAARFFMEKNEKKFGIQVLSNIAEMKLENAELMRMLANQLLEANEKELAIETFRDVMKMREEDPQSYRDLALALNEAGKYNEAVELLYKIITESWDGRFGEIKAVAINEMNAIISAHKDAVNTTAIDSRLVYAMPVDVRIVIGWSSDNSDIDLWVTDPQKEKCSYEHTDTEMGGKISQDVTQGFGPEEFILKKALNGKYKVEVNLFGDTRQTLGGPISIKADLFTDFGKPTQKKETINFRVTTNKEVVELGALKFGS